MPGAFLISDIQWPGADDLHCPILAATGSTYASRTPSGGRWSVRLPLSTPSPQGDPASPRPSVIWRSLTPAPCSVSRSRERRCDTLRVASRTGNAGAWRELFVLLPLEDASRVHEAPRPARGAPAARRDQAARSPNAAGACLTMVDTVRVALDAHVSKGAAFGRLLPPRPIRGVNEQRTLRRREEPSSMSHVPCRVRTSSEPELSPPQKDGLTAAFTQGAPTGGAALTGGSAPSPPTIAYNHADSVLPSGRKDRGPQNGPVDGVHLRRLTCGVPESNRVERTQSRRRSRRCLRDTSGLTLRG